MQNLLRKWWNVMATSKKTKKLGKGLDAIFNEASQGADIQSMINAIEKKAPQLSQVMVALKDIRPNPYQSRKHFDEGKLNELAQSIQGTRNFSTYFVKRVYKRVWNSCRGKTF